MCRFLSDFLPIYIYIYIFFFSFFETNFLPMFVPGKWLSKKIKRKTERKRSGKETKIKLFFGMFDRGKKNFIRKPKGKSKDRGTQLKPGPYTHISIIT